MPGDGWRGRAEGYQEQKEIKVSLIVIDHSETNNPHFYH
jgi:hypothetical protein